MRVGQARKRDANEKAICEALEACGAHVLRLGVQDAPDLLVRVPARLGALRQALDGSWGKDARLVLLEVKNPKGKNAVSEGQSAFQQAWPEVVVVRSVQEALQAIGCEVRP